MNILKLDHFFSSIVMFNFDYQQVFICQFSFSLSWLLVFSSHCLSPPSLSSPFFSFSSLFTASFSFSCLSSSLSFFLIKKSFNLEAPSTLSEFNFDFLKDTKFKQNCQVKEKKFTLLNLKI